MVRTNGSDQISATQEEPARLRSAETLPAAHCDEVGAVGEELVQSLDRRCIECAIDDHRDAEAMRDMSGVCEPQQISRSTRPVEYCGDFGVEGTLKFIGVRRLGIADFAQVRPSRRHRTVIGVPMRLLNDDGAAPTTRIGELVHRCGLIGGDADRGSEQECRGGSRRDVGARYAEQVSDPLSGCAFEYVHTHWGTYDRKSVV